MTQQTHHVASADPADAPREANTRAKVQQAVSEDGPITAVAIAELLGLTPTAVRRHLDALESAGLITEHSAAPSTRGRGRPARSYVLSAAGHDNLDASYDDVATSALRFLSEQVGEHAVEAFAHHHVAALEERYRHRIEAAGDDPEARAQVLAEALSQDGYAASSRPLRLSDGSQVIGIQLCQGHCPVQQVANEFPQFCDAEQQAFSRLLGVHVQRLATLAHGEHVCTTFVPVTALAQAPPPPHAGAPGIPTLVPPDHDERSAP